MGAKKANTRKASSETQPASPSVDGEGGVLLRAILNEPDDLEARLVYADWLLERGDARGELIHVQCVLGGVARGASAHRWGLDESDEALGVREKKLLKKHQKQWLAPFRAYIRTWVWSRGFVERVEADALLFAAGLSTILKHTPLRDAKLTGMKRPILAELAEHVGLNELTAFDISRQRIDDQQLDFLASPNLSRLHTLHLWGNPLGDRGAEVLASNAALRSLRDLHLYKTGISAAGLAALAQAPFFPELRRLDLSNLEIGPQGGAALLKLDRIEKLSITRGAIGDELLAQLLEKQAQTLQWLTAHGNDAGPATARVLDAHPHLQEVVML